MKMKLILIGIILLSLAVLIYFFGLGGAIAGIFESIALYALANPDQAGGYVASAYKQLRAVNFWFERSAVGKGLESTINLAASKVNGEGVDLLPHGIRIKWVEPQDREAFLKDGKILVCLESSQNEPKNIARAAFLYASEDLVRESQRFINNSVLKSACFVIARKILMVERKVDALRCLNEEFLKPEIAEDGAIGEYLATMEKLDQEGVFTRIFMNELAELDTKLPSVLSSPKAEQESISFLGIMKKLADKQKGVDINPTHRGEIIDMSLMLIARDGMVDPTPYINYSERCWRNGVSKLYVMALYNNIRLAKNALTCIKSHGTYKVEKEWQYEILFKGNKVSALLAVMERLNR